MLHSKPKGYLKGVVVLWIKIADHCKVSFFGASCKQSCEGEKYIVTPCGYYAIGDIKTRRWQIFTSEKHLWWVQLENVVSGVLPSNLHVFAEKPPWNWTCILDTVTDWGNSNVTHWCSPCQKTDYQSLWHATVKHPTIWAHGEWAVSIQFVQKVCWFVHQAHSLLYTVSLFYRPRGQLPGLNSNMSLHYSQTCTSFHTASHLCLALSLPWNSSDKIPVVTDLYSNTLTGGFHSQPRAGRVSL